VDVGDRWLTIGCACNYRPGVHDILVLELCLCGELSVLICARCLDSVPAELREIRSRLVPPREQTSCLGGEYILFDSRVACQAFPVIVHSITTPYRGRG